MNACDFNPTDVHGGCIMDCSTPDRTPTRFRVAVLCLLLLTLATVGCQKRDLRGASEHSLDEKTYLVVEDNNGGACGSILVDGKVWPYKTHVRGAISPGHHTIACGTQIEVEVPPRTIFHLDYWGP